MKIGIIGASGAVGREMINSLEDYKLDVEELRLFASERSVGKAILFNGNPVEIELLTQERLFGLDYVLGAVSNELSKKYWPMIEMAGAVYVDNSSAFRMNDNVPLIVPEINGEDALKHNGLISNPNCSTIITMLALAPINKLSKIKDVVATTFQAVSGAGNKGIEELKDQIRALENNEEIKNEVFPKQIAYNCIAEIGSYLDNGYTTEEMKMQNEGRKILHNNDLNVSCTCVRVPVYRSHSISVRLVTEKKLDLDRVCMAVDRYPSLKLFDEDIPTPLASSNQDDVYVGRIRRDLTDENGICLFCCGDQVRRGAASNAVLIIKYLEDNKQ
ncbi:MAG: aspartate-semialdehyde dehydrogenase [Erysipelotrichaceae bacterium]|nr:aspartate-semialdehyde dehydrogenase [Erysipelotrichaceae bacterium]